MLQDVIKKNFKGSAEKGTRLSFTATIWSVSTSKLFSDDGTSFGLLLSSSPPTGQTAQRAYAKDFGDQDSVRFRADTYAVKTVAI
jgi:hypothetical protein